MSGDELILQLGSAIRLLKIALADLNAVPNKKYCNNYATCNEITEFLNQFNKDEDKAIIQPR